MSQVRPHFDEWLPVCLPASLSAFYSTYLAFFDFGFKKIRQSQVKVCLVLTLQTLPSNFASKVHQKSNVNFGEFNVNLNPGWVSKHIHQRYLILMIIIILCLTMLNMMINDSDSVETKESKDEEESESSQWKGRRDRNKRIESIIKVKLYFDHEPW